MNRDGKTFKDLLVRKGKIEFEKPRKRFEIINMRVF